MEKFRYLLENEKINGAYINIPIELYTSPGYKDLSNDAILLYGVLLNSFKFSSQSGKRDEKGRLFVIASLSNIMKIIRCSRNKARKVLEELGKFHLIKFNEGEDRNKVRNIYLGVLRKEISEGNNTFKESNYVSSSNEISTSIGLTSSVILPSQRGLFPVRKWIKLKIYITGKNYNEDYNKKGE